MPNRTLVGILAAILLIGGGTMFWMPDIDPSDVISSSFMRVGFVLFTFWLAHPALERIPHWLAKGMLLLCFAILSLYKPKIMLIGIGVLLVLEFFKPRLKAELQEPSRK